VIQNSGSQQKTLFPTANRKLTANRAAQGKKEFAESSSQFAVSLFSSPRVNDLCHKVKSNVEAVN
jgi:hypothetical protein